MSDNIITVTDDSFDADVLFRRSCTGGLLAGGVCKMIAPVLEKSPMTTW